MLESLKNAFHRETPQEAMRRYKRSIDRSIRDLDREQRTLQTQEKKILKDMQKLAKESQVEAVRIHARDLVRTRRFGKKLLRMKAQFQSVSSQMTTMKATGEMTKAMSGARNAMAQMNKNMNLPALHKILTDFERQNDMLNMKGEAVSDCIDDALDDGDEEEETEMEVARVLDEAGLDFKEKVGVADKPLPAAAAATTASDAEDKELEARLAALKSSLK